MGYITFEDNLANKLENQVYNYNNPPNDDSDRKEKWLAWAKIGSIVGFALVVGGVLLLYSRKNSVLVETKVKKSFGKIEYTTPYKNILYENFGFVNEPKLTLPLKTKTGYKKITFLLDSGAVVSALPLKAARDVGVDFSQTKRIALQGFSGLPTFAYFGEITVKIGGEDFSFPAVFTESNGTSYILGRKGFFDQFSIYFNNKSKTVTITTRE